MSNYYRWTKEMNRTTITEYSVANIFPNVEIEYKLATFISSFLILQSLSQNWREVRRCLRVILVYNSYLRHC